MVKPVATVHVVPNLPEPLTRLRELAYNLRWSWDHELDWSVSPPGSRSLGNDRT